MAHVCLSLGDWPLAETHPRTKGKNDDDQDDQEYHDGQATAKYAKASKAAKPTPKADVKNLSQIEVAIQVLGKAGEPMSCKAMVEAMTTQGLWTSPGGARPDATLYSSILREINNNGRGAHFRKRESRSTLSPNG